MKTELLHRITPVSGMSIRGAALCGESEVVCMLSSGEVIRYDILGESRQTLFSIPELHKGIRYPDDGFDIEADISIYTMDEIVVIVNTYKRHGYVYHSQDRQLTHLWRGEYHADITCYPIALYKDHTGVPHLIYGVDWNHVQIMNLNTMQVLTADKSLIEQGAEDRYLENRKKYKDTPQLPWPTPYDYFYGRLLLSPDCSRFLSAGWHWGSSDGFNAYDIDRFISNHRIDTIPIGGWEHLNREVCWVDNDQVAIVFNPVMEDEGEGPCELHFYRISGDKAELERRVPVPDYPLDAMHLGYSRQYGAMVAFAPEGVALISPEGEVLFHEKTCGAEGYDPTTELFYSIKQDTIEIRRMV